MAQLRPSSTGSSPTDRVVSGRRRSVAALTAGALLATAATVTPSLLSGSGANAATVVQGKTWFDLNKNGIQDVPTNNAQTNETAIAGVPVLVTATDGETKTSVSGANGQWTVTMSAAGPYRVEFGQFPQPCPGVALPCVVTGPSVGGTTVQFPGTGQTTVNLGVFAKFNGLGSLEALTENELVEIGDRVWADTNANGIQDPGEPGIPGVTVKIDDQFGNIGFDEKVTDDNGNYLFKGLQNNLTYRVTVDSAQPALAGYTLTTGGQGNRAIDSDPAGLDAGGLAVANVPLRKAAENDHTFDFGWVPPVLKGSLGDRVWLDTNANGIQDDGENGIEGAIVKLLDKDGNPIAEKKTDKDGLYLFPDLDPARQYIIECQAPPALEGTVVRSPANQGTNDETDSDADATTGRTGLNSVPAGGKNLSVDCGWYVKPDTRKATLGNFVWEDINDNGIQDPSEPGIANVGVGLSVPANPLAFFTTTKTDASGKYLFQDLEPGTYRVSFAQPSGFKPAKPNVIGGNATDENDSDAAIADGSTGTYTLVRGDENLTVDAGFVRLPTTPKLKLGDRLFDDLNSNGIQDANEPGISGAKVELLDANGNVLATQNTIADGRYTFENLDAATYRVRFTAPAGRTFTTKDAGTDDGLDSDVNTAGLTDNVILVADNFNVDAGVLPTPVTQKLKLGDRLFDDLNSNGIQDANEPGISGAKVELLDANGNVLATQNTIADGRYTFFELNPGQYRVRFTAPAGRSFSARFAGTDRGLDSNVDGSGLSDLITLSSDDLTIDAGVVAVPTTVPPTVVPPTTTPPTTTAPPTTTKAPSTFCLGDKVFVDPGSSGGAQAKDGLGIPNVTLTLIRPDGSTATTVTDANGNYRFCGLVPGTYTVKVDPNTLPKGSTNTYDLDGDRNSETRVAATTDNPDLDFGYIYPVVVNTVVTAPPATAAPLPPPPPVETPSYTGSESTQRALLALSMLLVGFGLFGLARGRRRPIGA